MSGVVIGVDTRLPAGMPGPRAISGMRSEASHGMSLPIRLWCPVR